MTLLPARFCWTESRSISKTNNIAYIFQGDSTTRLGGVSTGTQSSLNLAVGRGDSLENVEENLRRLGRAVGFDSEKLVMTLQIHSDIVRVVTEKDRCCLSRVCVTF